MKKILLLTLSFALLLSNEFRYRKYDHIKTFYEPLAKKTLEIGLQNNIPPAAILAIASVESGYGRGYIASISGNILSLGTGKNEIELPALYLPNVKEPFEIIYNPKEIAKYKKSELVYKKREKSLKKDYRPTPFGGTQNNLEFFDNNPKEKLVANLACIEDFCTKWITYKSIYEPFKNARSALDLNVEKNGKKILLEEKTAIDFINSIGGKKHSFNYRESWPKKVITVMKNTGLVDLMQKLDQNKSFKEAW